MAARPARKTIAPVQGPKISLRRLFGSAKPDLVELGRALRQAQERGEFKAACEALPIHTRKAYDLITIAEAVDAGRLEARVCEELGWTKTRLIAALKGTKQQSRRAIAFARKNTAPALVNYIQQGNDGEALVTKSFHLTEAEAEELEDALQKAGARKSGGRLVNRSEALMTLVRMRRPANAPRSRRTSRTSE